MYLVNYSKEEVVLLWIYTHADFSGRPTDGDLATLLRQFFGE